MLWSLFRFDGGRTAGEAGAGHGDVHKLWNEWVDDVEAGPDTVPYRPRRRVVGGLQRRYMKRWYKICITKPKTSR